MRIVAPLAALFALAACGGGSDRAENTADALEEAAEVSTPAAAEVLENAADRIEEKEAVAPPGTPGSDAQQALERAGDVAGGQPPAPDGSVGKRTPLPAPDRTNREIMPPPAPGTDE